MCLYFYYYNNELLSDHRQVYGIGAPQMNIFPSLCCLVNPLPSFTFYKFLCIFLYKHQFKFFLAMYFGFQFLEFSYVFFSPTLFICVCVSFFPVLLELLFHFCRRRIEGLLRGPLYVGLIQFLYLFMIMFSRLLSSHIC